MEITQRDTDSSVLSEISGLDHFEKDGVRLHFNSGREFESETRTEYDEDGNEVKKTTIDTNPCPNVSVYSRPNERYEVVVWLPTPDPVILAWMQATEVVDMADFREFMDAVVEALEDGFEGINEVTSFRVSDSASEAFVEEIRAAFKYGTPDSVVLPAEAPAP